MSDNLTDKVERGARRGIAAVLGLILGVILGFLVGLMVFGFGDPLLITTGIVALACAAVCFKWPTPILTVARTALSIVGVEI